MEAKVCKGILCKGEKPPTTNFSPKGRICRECCNEKIKEYHKKNGRAYQNFKNELKSQSACVKCGCTDIRLLEFDHIGEKTITMAKSFSKKKIQDESVNTQILCVWCHRLKSREQMDKTREKLDEKFQRLLIEPSSSEGKSCKGILCNEKLRPLSSFYKTPSGIVWPHCRTCESYRGRSIRDSNQECSNSTKLRIGKCELCTLEVTPETTCAFDFDHLRDKSVNISILVRLNGDKRKQIQEEIEKCRLLCCRCHKLHTTDQQGFHYQSPAVI
jgi:hypothetical protein